MSDATITDPGGAARDAESGPIVDTRLGRLRGAREDGVLVFRDVPFAAPPVGTRRFLPPAPPVGWEGVRDATRPGVAPPQTVDPISETLGLAFDVPMREDCLALNVFTPAADDARRPVLVWLHGGAFATGTGSAPLYAGHRIARRGDVVVVTLNYRVGALGFLYLARRLAGAAGSEPGAGANLGLQDQIAALRFVRDEIAAFGGDPARVTVFGESAGAGSLSSLLAMPAARGLFRRAIVQSAAPDGVLSADEGDARCAAFLERLGVDGPPDALVASLRALPVEELLKAQRACIDAGPHRTGMFFAPVVDGETLPRAPLAAVDAGDARDVDVLIGTTSEEMQLYSTAAGLGDFDDALLEQIVAARVDADDAARRRIARDAVRVYREELARRLGRAPTRQELFFALESDLSLRVPATRLAADHARTAAAARATYMYLFTWRSPLSNGNGGTLGACHALDLPFTFGALDAERARAFAGAAPPRADAARRLSDRIIDAWTAFAARGDPSHADLPRWPRYAADRRATMRLDETCEVVLAPLERERAVWDAARGEAR